MKDFARVPTGNQATRLNWFEVRLRQLCYLLAQKGNPEAEARIPCLPLSSAFVLSLVNALMF
ncbi:TPA: hypothetical protein MG828_16260 [Klebsiella pneumoniae]|nr:hypothetical protein L364_03249 [Klebsiella pneumoniae MGH 18]HBX3048334.1 hypothetical protein [Klebsiella pneumoniae]HBX3070609.1 hypothetical protein [Klebsiella pneumoniae]HBZ2254551.1 hypothetical protein [Klebsiella pneumoniae]